jgi:hypothetical protein
MSENFICRSKSEIDVKVAGVLNRRGEGATITCYC